MDPSSISASVVGMLAEKEQLCSLLSTTTEPSKELHELQAELSELETVLQMVQTSLSDVPESSPMKIDAVSKALVELADLQSSLQPKVTMAGENVGGDHWQWIRKKSNIERLRNRLISIRRELTALVIPQSSCLPEQGPRYYKKPIPPRIPEFNHSSADDFSPFRRSITPRVPGVIRSIRPCYVLIFLGLLTIVGSLVPALWRSISQKDISGGFSLAQYILGVGVFVVGCVVAIHSRTCKCWSSSTHGSSLELDPIDNTPNVQPYELPG